MKSLLHRKINLVMQPRRYLASLPIMQKTQLLLALMLIVLFITLYSVLQYIVSTSFTTIEHDAAIKTVQNFEKELDGQRGQLSRLSIDYAVWDDTYHFLRGEQPEFVERNMGDAMFEANQLDIVVIADSQGVIRYRQIRGPYGELPIAEQTAIASTLLSSAISRESIQQNDAVASFVDLPDWPVVISAHPVLQSDYSGPTAGILIMGRRLDTQLVREMEDRLTAAVRFHKLLPGTDAHTPAALSQLLAGTQRVITPHDDVSIHGFTLISDADGRPALVGEISQPRTIWMAGRQLILWTLGVFVIAGCIFALTLVSMLNRVVLKRLGQLTAGVQQVGEQQASLRQVSISGDDELGKLAVTINATLHALEDAEQERIVAHQAQIQLWDELHKERQQFLASVSHELRTPLTPVAAYTDMLLQGSGGPLSPDQYLFLKQIQSSAHRLRALIDDLLDMGRLEAKALRLHLEPVLVQYAVEESVAVLRSMIERLGVQVIIEIPPELPPVCADLRRFEQILINLISNAVKYNRPQGTVWIHASVATATMLAIAIKDTGIGLSDTQLQRLFTPFYRAEHPQTETVGGIGLGLYIVQALIELHSGQITVQSELDSGSTFTIWLPWVDLSAAS
jgi:signal transduction histidine kinase